LKLELKKKERIIGVPPTPTKRSVFVDIGGEKEKKKRKYLTVYICLRNARKKQKHRRHNHKGKV